MRPPLLPAEILRRVIQRARLNGWSVVIFAGLCALGSLVFRDFLGASVGLLVTLGGTLEVRGYRMLKRHDAGGMRWLVGSQFVVLVVIWAYGISRLSGNNDQMVRTVFTLGMRRSLGELGLTLDDILPQLRLLIGVLYGSVLTTALIYQGGLALYYPRRTPAVESALNSARATGSIPPVL